MTYPDKPPPEAYRLVPEVAAAYPRVSRDGKTWTFTLRSGFRFSDGTPVRATAFARAITRTLAPGVRSRGAAYTRGIVGAEDVQAGRTAARRAWSLAATSSSFASRGRSPISRAQTTMPFFCAVPPTLPADPEGVGAFPAAGPYYVAEYRPGQRVVIRRNRFYRGTRPHHVDGFDVDLTRGRPPQAVVDRVERGEADWAWVPPSYYSSRAAG